MVSFFTLANYKTNTWTAALCQFFWFTKVRQTDVVSKSISNAKRIQTYAICCCSTWLYKWMINYLRYMLFNVEKQWYKCLEKLFKSLSSLFSIKEKRTFKLFDLDVRLTPISCRCLLLWNKLINVSIAIPLYIHFSSTFLKRSALLNR